VLALPAAVFAVTLPLGVGAFTATVVVAVPAVLAPAEVAAG
jgi:hypothetical protein